MAGTGRVAQAARFFGQSLLSLLFDAGGLVAGALLATFFAVFTSVPWAILVFPGILSIRGAVGGIFSGRLSTALHIGSIRPAFLHNTTEYRDLIRSVVILTMMSAISMSAMAALFSMALLGTSGLEILWMAVVVIATMGLSLLVVSPVTIAVSIFSVRRGLDPDVVTYPIVSTVADILVTTCYIAILTLYTTYPDLMGYIVAFDLLFMLTGISLLVSARHHQAIMGTLREFLVTLVAVVVIVNITGSFLDRISQVVRSRPDVYFVYPALIDTVGDVGSIVGSTTTTELTLGTISPSLCGLIQHMSKILMAWLASLCMFGVYGLVASLCLHLSVAVTGQLLLILLVANALSVAIVSVLSFSLAILTARHGLNPDNLVIPIESSMADTVTTIALLVGIILLAV